MSSWNLARVSVLVEVQRAVGGGGDERQVDLRLLRPSDSSILAFSAASLRRCTAILSLDEVDAVLALERLRRASR